MFNDRIHDGELGFTVTEALLDQTLKNTSTNEVFWYFMDSPGLFATSDQV